MWGGVLGVFFYFLKFSYFIYVPINCYVTPLYFTMYVMGVIIYLNLVSNKDIIKQ